MKKKPWEYGPLHAAEGKPYLMNGETPFFWMGDTAWLLFHLLNKEEVELYLRNRAEKGYNVVQAPRKARWRSASERHAFFPLASISST